MGKHPGGLATFLSIAVVASMLLLVLPGEALAGNERRVPESAVYAGSDAVIPKFWVEPDKAYVPPPVAATASRDPGRGVNGYAALFGINAYPSSPLQGCISDITQIRDKLVNSYGWSNANIHFVTDAAVTPARIVQEVQWLASVADPSSQTVFAFSGHGSAHTIWAYPMNGVSDDTLAPEFKKFKSSENIIIMDSCFSGANTAVNITNPPFISMMACAADETAADGNTFSKAWVEGLGTTQWGETEDAFAYAYNKIKDWQHPQMWDSVPGKMMLGRKPPMIQGTLQNMSAPEDTPMTMTLTNYESDPVDGHAQLNWSVDLWESGAIQRITGQNSANDTLTFVPAQDWNGRTTVGLVLSNSAGRTARQNITLTWTPVNDPPAVKNFDKLWPSVERTKAVKAVVYGGDVDNDPTTLGIEASYRPAGGDWTAVDSQMTFVSNRWEFDFAPPASCPLGMADIRARLKDFEGWCEWRMATGFIQILNSPPAASALNASAGQVHRMQNITISVSGADPESPRERLVCELELKMTNQTSWARLSPVSLAGDRWTAVFRPQPGAPLGAYDVRARLRDTDAAYGDWKERYGLFNVLNALPVLGSVELSTSSMERGDPAILTIKGSDIEDPLPLVSCDVHYKGPSGQWARLENVILKGDHWEARFLPLSYFKPGDYSFRVVLKDTTGQMSDWIYLNSRLAVTNSLPRASSINASRGSLLRTQNMTIKIEGRDYEDKSSNLTCMVEYSAGQSAVWEAAAIQNLRYDERFSDWVCTFDAAAGLPAGSYSFRARLRDRDGDWGGWYVSEQNLLVQNNPPVARLAPHPGVANEKSPVRFDATQSTDIEGLLDFHWDFGDGSTADEPQVAHTFVQGGQKEVVLTVTDADGATGEVRFRLRVNLLPVPQATYRQMQGIDDFRVGLDASLSSDAEGQVAAYIWDFDTSVDSDLDGKTDNDIDSSSPNPTFDYKKEGTYIAKLTVVDADNGNSSLLFTVKVKKNLPVEDNTIYMLLGLIIIGGVGAGVGLAVRRRRSPPEARQGRVDEATAVPAEALPATQEELLPPEAQPLPYQAVAAQYPEPLQSYPQVPSRPYQPYDPSYRPYQRPRHPPYQ